MTEREWLSGEIRDLGIWLWGASYATPGASVVKAGEKWAILWDGQPYLDPKGEPILLLSRDGAIAHLVRMLRAAGKGMR